MKVSSFTLRLRAMMTLSHSHLSRRRLALLLWLVLLLPLGQMTATVHMLSHVHSGQADGDEGTQGLHEDHCDLCATAATLLAGAPVATTPLALPVSARHEAALVVLHDIVWSAPAAAYNSRAPPVSLR
jgi:hypothetical protein